MIHAYHCNNITGMLRIIFLLMTFVCHQGVQAQQMIKVLSYNIHHGENVKGELDIQGIANIILATNPDLVALQEVDSATSRVHKADQLKELAAQTGMYTYFAKSMDYDGGSYGNGILSRFPIEKSYSIMLPAKGEPRCAAIVTVRLPGDSLLYFASTHLDHLADPADRIAQASILLQHFQQLALPVLLAGDLNAIPAAREIGTLKSIFTDVTDKTGPTWPSDNPSQKIDYILVSPKLKWDVIHATALAETVASDHRPVLCELLLK